MYQPTSSHLTTRFRKALFSSKFRVLHLRVTIGISFGSIVASAISFIFFPPGNDPGWINRLEAASLSISSVIIFRRLLGLWDLKLNVLSLHFCMIWLEAISASAIIWFNEEISYPILGVTFFIQVVLILQCIVVSLDVYFLWLRPSPKWDRRSRLVSNIGKLVFDRYHFLDGCSGAHTYTANNILPIGSLRRPLIRGEARWIIFMRVLVLLGLCFVLPIFMFYTVIYNPTYQSIYTRSYQEVQTIFPRRTGDPFVPNQVTIMSWSPSLGNNTCDIISVNVYQPGLDTPPCPVRHTRLDHLQSHAFVCLAECPFSWNTTTNVTITSNFTALQPNGLQVGAVQNAIYIYPGGGHPNDIARYTVPILLLPGADLLGVLTWTQREVYPDYGLDFFQDSLTNSLLFNAEIQSLYPNPVPTVLAPNTTRLCLVQNSIYPTQYLQDYVTTTALGGVSSVGGLWTVLNGVFVFLFGANALYFFGLRPLSAMGFIHIFQGSKLQQNLLKDYPKFHKEGGRPGSEDAGLVAFFRERQLDFPEDVPADSELPQHHRGDEWQLGSFEDVTADLELQQRRREDEQQLDSPQEMSADWELQQYFCDDYPPVHNEDLSEDSNIVAV